MPPPRRLPTPSTRPVPPASPGARVNAARSRGKGKRCSSGRGTIHLPHSCPRSPQNARQRRNLRGLVRGQAGAAPRAAWATQRAPRAWACPSSRRFPPPAPCRTVQGCTGAFVRGAGRGAPAPAPAPAQSIRHGRIKRVHIHTHVRRGGGKGGLVRSQVNRPARSAGGCVLPRQGGAECISRRSAASPGKCAPAVRRGRKACPLRT